MDFSFGPPMGKRAGGADAYSSSDSGSDDESNAYRMPATDPAETEFSEFQPRKRRRTGRNGKESAALGIFGSESDDDHSSRRWKERKPLRKQGMSFVSTGAKKGEDDDGEEDDEEEGDNESDEESDEDGRFGMSAAAKRAAGMSANADPRDNVEADDYDDDDDDDEAAAGVGLGFVPASFQSSKRTANPTTRKPPPSFQPASTSTTATYDTVDAHNPLGQGFVPSSAYEPVLRPQGQRTKEPPVVARPSAFSKPAGGRGGAGGGGGGSAYNPKSFGARMMAKMGFVEGQGLGTEGQGRNIIIEANLRPQGVGLGAVREKSDKERQEEKRQARLRGEEVVDSEEEERKAKAAARKKKAAARAGGAFSGGGTSGASGTSTPRRPKKKYMTMDEVKRAAPGLHIPEAFTPILDMTGPGRKLLTSSSGLMTPTSSRGDGGAAGMTPGTPADEKETAEQAEARKLARRAQSDFMAILEEWQSLQSRKAFAELQMQQERQELAALEARLQGHTAMTDAFAQLSVQSGDEPAGAAESWLAQWDRTISQLQRAAETIPPSSLDDMAMKDTLADVAVAALHPVFKQALQAWQPLVDNDPNDPNQYLVDGLQSLQGLLGFGAGEAGAKLLEGGISSSNTDQASLLDALARRPHKSKTASPYEAMMYTLWLPAVLAAVRAWDVVHDTERMLALYEAWLPLLPDFVRGQLLEEIVRRLDDAVSKWEPKRRRNTSSSSASQNLPHLWLFPWLPHLPARHLDPSGADGLVVKVKRKFRQLVDVWEFYRGVVPGLRQWKAVLRPPPPARDEWRPLVMAHVLPSMARYVRAQFRVDPRDQAPYLEVITGEFQWLALLAPEVVAEVMVAELFPMWHEALYQLLTATATSLSCIGQWLQWWTDEVFPAAVQRVPSVAAEFDEGLAQVNEALDIGVTGENGGYDAERVRQYLAPPSRGPALKSTSSHASRHNGHHGHSHSHRSRHEEKKPSASSTAAPSAGAPEEMSIRHYVEDWCEANDVQFIPERKKVHAEGRPLYRLTARGDGRGGVLAYFQGVRLYVETKKGPLEIRVDREDDWPRLLEMVQ
ncbi:hypothetical protein SCUCBS95973_006553 [Sporothrix curviconia]|uniref:G-patch domain-containing protein n=1 Tax=Sporothrix curviconia TaxID=1260050 RepID=A0ABP0C643_9PEZI